MHDSNGWSLGSLFARKKNCLHVDMNTLQASECRINPRLPRSAKAHPCTTRLCMLTRVETGRYVHGSIYARDKSAAPKCMLAGCTRDQLQQRCNTRRVQMPTQPCNATRASSLFMPKPTALKPWARVPALLLSALKAKHAKDVACSEHTAAGVLRAATAAVPARPPVSRAGRWQRLVRLALVRHGALVHIVRAWQSWRVLWARGKRVRLLTTASGVYCYELPELAVRAAVAADGASELAHEYCVLKVGITQCAGGGFLNRLRTEMRDIEKWRDSARLGLEQRLVFLLTSDGACGHERRVLEGLGVHIGVAPVDRSASAAALQALAVAEPGASVEDAVCKKSSRLKVQNGWRLWLSGRTPRSAVGPSEFIVVHRAVVARLRRECAARPGALQVNGVLACAAQFRGPRLRRVELDFAHAERSLGALVFALRNP